MTEFVLDVAAVVVGVAVYGWIRHRIVRFQHTFRPSDDPWDNW